MHRFLRAGNVQSTVLVGLLLAVGIAAGCGSSSKKKGGQKIDFQGEQKFLPDFEQDSGYVPSGSPGKLRVVASARGAIGAGAQARSGGSNLSPVSGSGNLSMDGGLNLGIHTKIDFMGYKYEGKLKTIEYGIEPKNKSFDPFLLDDEVSTTAELPSEDLAELPVPSIPIATVVISVEGGSVTTSFRGSCAQAADGVGQYLGETVTSGTVEIAGTIKLEIPVTGTKTFGPFSIPVDIPEIPNALDLGTRSLSNGKSVESPNPCTMSPPADAGMLDAGDGPGDAGTEDPDAEEQDDPDAAGPKLDVDGGGCPGCRLPTDAGPGRCVQGGRKEACGTGGVVCKICRDDERCMGGSCVKRNCSQSSCPNGCCRNGQCLNGNSGDACGSGGEACTQCGEGEKCENGQCVSHCGPSNCSGCCNSSGNCVAGTQAATCGSGGESCTSCGSSQKCHGGKCVSSSCSQSCAGCCDGSQCRGGTSAMACGHAGEACRICPGGNTCTQQECAPRQNSTWNVVAVRGVVPSSNGQWAWDNRWNDPDPYVEVTITGTASNESGRTKAKDGDTTPHWNETVVTGIPANALTGQNDVEIDVRDEDPYSGDDWMASCSVEFDSDQFDRNNVEFQCDGDEGIRDSEIYLKLKHQP